ncbi:MAG: hypothetical protein Ct9H90mP10_09610 [Actinomycetota bacterium]|nr:MAG: hypothetical protein Ct9H90mP10_09610 [Actinomycetota bacterium]
MNIPEKNTVSKSLNLLREINDFSKYFEINITKNIPTESGLGGGSSNAGALFRSCQKYITYLFHPMKMLLKKLVVMSFLF